MTELDTSRRAAPHRIDGRDFRRYLWACGTSSFGTLFTGVATSALAVDMFHVTGVGAGLLRTAGTLPALFVAPLAGVLSDRLARPRRVLIATELVGAVAVGLFAFAIASGTGSFPLLLAITAVLGATGTVAGTVFFTHLSSLRPAHLSAARAKLQTTNSMVGVAAGAAAAPLIAAFGPVVALLTDAVSYLLSAAGLRSIAAPDVNPGRAPLRPETTIRRDLAEGVRVLLRSRLRPVVWYALLAQAAFTGMAGLKPIFLLRTLNIPLYLYGVPGLAVMAAGVLGSLLAARSVSTGRSPGRTTARWWLGAALALLCLPLSGGSTVVVLAVASLTLAVMALCSSAANVAVVALYSETIPEHAMGRVNATLMVLGAAATTIGAPLAGVLADLIGVRAAILVCGICCLAGLPLLRSWWREGGEVVAGSPAPVPANDVRP